MRINWVVREFSSIAMHYKKVSEQRNINRYYHEPNAVSTKLRFTISIFGIHYDRI